LGIGMGSHHGLATPSPDMGRGKSISFLYFHRLGHVEIPVGLIKHSVGLGC